MEYKKSRTIIKDDFCKYRDKKVVKTVNDVKELIKNYSRTNELLNNHIIKKDIKKDVHLIKSFTFYTFIRIVTIIIILLVTFSIGFLIGYNMPLKYSLMTSFNHNFVFIDNQTALVINPKTGEKILKLNATLESIFSYNNLFMGTFATNMLLLYYPSNEIGLNANEFCYNPKANVIVTNKQNVSYDNIFAKFTKKNEESLIFINNNTKINDDAELSELLYMNDLLYKDINSYPIGGSDLGITLGILYGISSISFSMSINYVIDDNTILNHLLEDCKKGRIYIQLSFLKSQVQTFFFIFKPQIGSLFPFKISCKIIDNIDQNKTVSEFRTNVIKHYKIQKAAVRNINFFIS